MYRSSRATGGEKGSTRRSRAFVRPLSDAEADACVRAWAVLLAIPHAIRRERISVWQVTGERGRPGCELVGVCTGDDGACILHTRRLTEEDIVHELLHVTHPDWSEAEVVAETARCAEGSPKADSATFIYSPTRRVLQRAPGLPAEWTSAHDDCRTKGSTDGIYGKESPKRHHLLPAQQGDATARGQRTLYFFRKEVTEGAQDNLPPGYEVSESATTGLPLLKKKSE